METIAQLWLVAGVNLAVMFVLAYGLAPVLRKDPLLLMLAGALFSVLGLVLAAIFLPTVEPPGDERGETPRKPSRRHRRKLEEAARRSFGE